jgi:hypothetical protein
MYTYTERGGQDTQEYHGFFCKFYFYCARENDTFNNCTYNWLSSALRTFNFVYISLLEYNYIVLI